MGRYCMGSDCQRARRHEWYIEHAAEIARTRGRRPWIATPRVCLDCGTPVGPRRRYCDVCRAARERAQKRAQANRRHRANREAYNTRMREYQAQRRASLSAEELAERRARQSEYNRAYHQMRKAQQRPSD